MINSVRASFSTNTFHLRVSLSKCLLEVLSSQKHSENKLNFSLMELNSNSTINYKLMKASRIYQKSSKLSTSLECTMLTLLSEQRLSNLIFGDGLSCGTKVAFIWMPSFSSLKSQSGLTSKMKNSFFAAIKVEISQDIQTDSS